MFFSRIYCMNSSGSVGGWDVRGHPMKLIYFMWENLLRSNKHKMFILYVDIPMCAWEENRYFIYLRPLFVSVNYELMWGNLWSLLSVARKIADNSNLTSEVNSDSSLFKFIRHAEKDRLFNSEMQFEKCVLVNVIVWSSMIVIVANETRNSNDKHESLCNV